MLGLRVARAFTIALNPETPDKKASKWFAGYVVEEVAGSKPPLWRVYFDDDDTEELEVRRISELLLLMRSPQPGQSLCLRYGVKAVLLSAS